MNFVLQTYIFSAIGVVIGSGLGVLANWLVGEILRKRPAIGVAKSRSPRPVAGREIRA